MLDKLKKLFKKPGSQGFTIIEVMIVLAVAALIILIVLLAVPALQRSSRNTTIKNDASTVASAISDWSDNNDGALPATVSGTGTVTLSGTAGANPDNVKVQGSTKVSTVSGLPTAGGSIQPGEVQVWFGHKCSTTLGDTNPADYLSNTRATAVFYITETSGSNQLQCIDS